MSPISAIWQRASLLSLLIASAFLALVMRPAVASEANPPKYDVQTETKIKGTVQDVTLPASGHEKEVVHLVLKIDNDTIDVYLCPKSFLDDMGVEFKKGDEIAVTGSKVKSGDTDLVLVRQAQKGSDTLILRDDKGNPVWIWSSKK